MCATHYQRQQASCLILYAANVLWNGKKREKKIKDDPYSGLRQEQQLEKYPLKWKLKVADHIETQMLEFVFH